MSWSDQDKRFDDSSAEQVTVSQASIGAGGFLEQALWTRFGEAATLEEFASAWLELQCEMIDGATSAVVVLKRGDSFVPMASWPPHRELQASMTSVAELAIEERRGVVRASHDEGTDALAFPVLVDEDICGVAAIAVSSRPELALRAVMRQLQWGVSWLEILARRKSLMGRDQLGMVLELVAVCAEQVRFQGAATAFATELATRLGCDRVSVGFRRGKHTRVEALSHSADFGGKSNLTRAIGSAMDEAVDQQEAVVHPAGAADALPQITRAHAELARQQGAGAVCSVPFGDGSGNLTGAICFERPAAAPFDSATMALCTRIAALVGPILETKRRDDRWLVVRAWHAGKDLLAKLFGAGHLSMKLAFLLLIAVALFLSFAKGSYRVSADAVLEGTVQRVVTAPMNGYIFAAPVRSGDLVRQGEELAVLDDKDLRLERVKWASQREQRQREYNEALAAHNRARVRILGAQISQADAQLRLLDEQLSRTRLQAPFDGVVVSGDLSQKLGAPVERGEVLFEVAPLDAYRIILKVDERDISQVSVEQRGQLALAGAPGVLLPLTVEKMTPVSAADEGRNYFRVEATLDEPTELLRPGMEGIGKIDIEERLLVWIWTHKLIAFVKLWIWSWSWWR